MKIKKKLIFFLVAALCICLFSAFGFQIDVAGGINKDGGTADVSVVEPLRVEVDLAKAALATAQQAVDDAKTALAAAQSADDLANVALAAAQSAADLVNAALLEAIAGGDVAVITAAQSAADVANATLTTAQRAADVANTTLTTAQQAADDANTAYLALIAGNEEKLLALLSLQQAADVANAALATAQLALDKANTALANLPATATPEEIAAAELIETNANAALIAAQQEANDANAALEESISEKIKVSHIITNSNNGGSFTIGGEGNHSVVYGEVLPFTFASKEGFDLVWLRIGNTKITATSDVVFIPYLESFNKKNLTIHAHFKKDKDYVPETTVEGTSLDGEVLQVDTDNNKNVKEDSNKNVKEDGNGNGKKDGNGSGKEKSNNGKKK